MGRVFLAACALAGALAVPFSAVGTPVAAAIAAVLAAVGLRVWRWSRLPQLARERGAGRWQSAGHPGCFALGLGVGLVILTIIRWAIEPALPSIGARIAAAGLLPLWRRALIIYVAAVGEELLFRLLLLSLIAGVIARARRGPAAVPRSPECSTANAVAALAFAMVHMPAWRGVPGGGVLLLGSVVVLNMLGGLILGYVFISRGIVPAMVTHAGADCAVQMIGPLTGPAGA